MVKDMRSFLREYEAANPDDVIHIKKRLNTVWECSAVAKKFDMADQYPLLVFHNVINANGRLSPHATLVNLAGDRRKMAFALGTEVSKVSHEWAERVRNRKTAPKVVERKDAPCKEVVLRGREVDLRELPILKIHEMDPGHYITNLFTCRHPENGAINSSNHRGFVAGPRELRCALNPHSHAWANLMAYEKRGQEMKVAYWVAHHPAVLMGTATQSAYGENHYNDAGAMLGEPLRVVSSETLGEDFMVPADTEWVIEGVIRPGARGQEAPFGEYPRYYGPQCMNPVMEVHCVTHRRDAIWETHMVGMVHDFGAAQEEHHLLETVKKAVPQVTAIHIPRSGCGRFHCYVQLRKTHDGQPRQAIMTLLGGSTWLKHVVVVDDDIDLTSDREVLWAIATRVQAHRDVMIVPDCAGSWLDPSALRFGQSSKMGIDATKPAPPRRFPLRTNLPDEVMKRIRLEDLIEPDLLRRRGI